MTPHAAALHPARLARGLACAVERHGGVIHEHTRVRSIDDRHVRTDGGTVRAEVVVRATEAYTVSISGQERAILPLANYVVATEPIDDATWTAIGLAHRELFEIAVNMVAYGQRTADGRIVFGGLSGPTWWQSRIPASPMRDRRVERRLEQTLRQVFPPLRDIRFTHHWGGVLGVPTRPAPRRRLRPQHGIRMGGRLLRPGRRVRQRRRPHARRPRLRCRQRDGPAALGRARVATVGARAPALARRARRGRVGTRTRLARHPPILIRHEGGPRCGSPCRCR